MYHFPTEMSDGTVYTYFQRKDTDILLTVAQLYKKMEHHNSYECLTDFSFDSVWNEMESNIPFVINVMNAVCWKSYTSADLGVKYRFLYTTPMNERWHELSLLKHVNTVLVIKGRCAKKVRISLTKLIIINNY